jgi:hypothetical protein
MCFEMLLHILKEAEHDGSGVQSALTRLNSTML